MLKNILDERRQAEAREAEDQRKEKERQKRLRAGAQYVIKFKGEYYDTYILYIYILTEELMMRISVMKRPSSG